LSQGLIAVAEPHRFSSRVTAFAVRTTLTIPAATPYIVLNARDVRVTDPGADMTAPPAPWDGIYAPTDSVQRFELVHHVEELARHAGHADIIREQIDGANAGSLLMAVEGRDGNDFVQPWTPPKQ